MSIWNDIKFQFRTGGILNQLLFVNIGMFVLFQVIRMICYLTEAMPMADEIEHLLSIPASFKTLILQPWSLLTHMFFHVDFWHFLINMVFLFYTGKIFLRFLDSKRLLSTYILGGLTGAAVFMVAMNVFPKLSYAVDYSYALGASAAALSVVLAAAVVAPNLTVYFMWIWPLKLKYLAGIFVITDILTFTDGNAGGHLAHLGGALFGFVYSFQLKRGTDFTVDFLRPIYWLRSKLNSRPSKIKVVHSRAKTDEQFNEEKVDRQEQIDAILDKIKRSGYESLSKKEKEILFKASKEI